MPHRYRYICIYPLLFVSQFPMPVTPTNGNEKLLSLNLTRLHPIAE